MKHIILAFLLFVSYMPAIAQHKDTVLVTSKDLNAKRLQQGEISYLQYAKKTKESIPTRITLITFNVRPEVYHRKQVIAINQQWNSDTTTHTCYTLLDANSFATLIHNTYWKRLGYSMKFDFNAKTVYFVKSNSAISIPDSVKATVTKDFEQSFHSFFLNWHADILLYSLLDYRLGRTFIINYFDPGFGAPEKTMYTVTGSDPLTDRNGQKIDCWVLNHFNDDKSDEKGYERFWISKRTNEVLKMEDYGGPGQNYRYKLKLGISGEK